MVVRPPEITDEDLNNIPKVKNGHTREIINRSIMARRHMLHPVMAKGLNTFQAASVLGCSHNRTEKPNVMCSCRKWGERSSYILQRAYENTFNHLRPEVSE
jgi:hypothetical protein